MSVTDADFLKCLGIRPVIMVEPSNAEFSSTEAASHEGAPKSPIALKILSALAAAPVSLSPRDEQSKADGTAQVTVSNDSKSPLRGKGGKDKPKAETAKGQAKGAAKGKAKAAAKGNGKGSQH